MRKNILILTFSLVSIGVSAQLRLGFQLSPTLSTNRIEAESVMYTLETDGAGLRLALGPIIDYELSENYFLSTGILFTSKRASLEAIPVNPDLNTFTETYNLQYLQIPITMKLYTNEVALDKKIYFQFGTSMEFIISEKSDDSSNFFLENFRTFDSSLLAGIGLDYQLGTNTALFAGFSYHRGLINTVKEHSSTASDISLKNDYLGLDVGVRF